MARAPDAPKRSPAGASLHALDRRATRALAEANGTAARELRALAALDALQDGCARGGALAHAVRAERERRTRAFAAQHREAVALAIEARVVHGARARARLVRALEESIAFLRATAGETGELRALELQLADARRGESGAPRPFFARFLEDGRPRRRSG